MRLHFESELKKPSGSAQSAAYHHSKLWDKRFRESHRSGLGNTIERFRCFERPSNGGTTGARFWGRYIRGVLAEALARSEKIDQGLELCDSVLDEIEQPDCRERWHYAELLRLRGWMLSLKGDVRDGERSYEASLEWARQQRAKSWELRTSMSLARLWRDQGKVPQARELLAPIYGWFTEGLDTRDLKEAKALLEQLEA
jgi:predicted ATPase